MYARVWLSSSSSSLLLLYDVDLTHNALVTQPTGIGRITGIGGDFTGIDL
jgi:hypothetical protein